MAKLKKGSKAAKAFMAKIRKMRKNPGKKRAAKKRASKSKYKTKHIQAASKFAKGSIRTVKRGDFGPATIGKQAMRPLTRSMIRKPL